MSFSSSYFHFIARFKIYVFFFWFGIILLFGLVGYDFLNNLDVEVEPPSNTKASTAKEHVTKFFPETTDLFSLIILLERHDGQSIKTPETKEVILAMTAFVTDYIAKKPDVVKNIHDYYSLEFLYPDIAKQLISPDETAIISVAQHYDMNVVGWQPMRDFQDAVQDKLDAEMARVFNSSSLYTAGLTGWGPMFAQTLDEATSDFLRMDSIVLPMALCVFALYLRNVRYIMLPAINVALTVCLSFTLMYPIALHMLSVQSFTPSIMVSISIATGIDYALFLSSRFGEEIASGRAVELAVLNVVKYTGAVILSSGTTLAITFTGLLFFPISLLQSIGLGCAITVICAMLVWYLSAACPAVPPPSDAVREFCGNNGTKKVSDEPLLSDTEAPKGYGSIVTPVKIQEENESEKLVQLEKSFWFKSARMSTGPRAAWLVIFLVLAFSAFFIVQLFYVDTSADANLMNPRDAKSLKIFKELEVHFPPGFLGPFNILVSTPAIGGIWSPEFYGAARYMTERLLAAGLVHNGTAGILTVNYAFGTVVTFHDADQYIFNTSSLYGLLYNKTFYEDMASAAPYKNQSMLVTIQTDFQPDGPAAMPWIDHTRAELASVAAHINDKDNADQFCRPSERVDGHCDLEFYLYNIAVVETDMRRKINDLTLPMILVITFGVFCVVALLFRSLVVPLRLLFTIGLSLCWTYGAAVMVFQRGWFNFLSEDVLGNCSGIYFGEIQMTFSVMVGLGLDYDIFLFSRIREFRMFGFTNRASIIRGVHMTGSVVTTAGVIMAIAFGGLMLSKTMVLVQYGFILSFAVVYDTFIVRTLLVPAVCVLLDEYNWWPGYVPKARYDELSMAHNSFLDQDVATGEDYQVMGDLPSTEDKP